MIGLWPPVLLWIIKMLEINPWSLAYKIAPFSGIEWTSRSQQSCCLASTEALGLIVNWTRSEIKSRCKPRAMVCEIIFLTTTWRRRWRWLTETPTGMALASTGSGRAWSSCSALESVQCLHLLEELWTIRCSPPVGRIALSSSSFGNARSWYRGKWRPRASKLS